MIESLKKRAHKAGMSDRIEARVCEKHTNTGSNNTALYGAGGSHYGLVDPFVTPWYSYNPAGAIWSGVMNASPWTMTDWYKTGTIGFGWPGVIPSLTYYDWSWRKPVYSGKETDYSGNGGIDPEDGVTMIKDLAMFETLACMSDVPGALSVREVKFLITGVDTDNPAVYFYNTKKHTYHFTFAISFFKSPICLKACPYLPNRIDKTPLIRFISIRLSRPVPGSIKILQLTGKIWAGWKLASYVAGILSCPHFLYHF